LNTCVLTEPLEGIRTSAEQEFGKTTARAGIFPLDAQHSSALAEFTNRLQALPVADRKLLAHIAAFAYRDRHDGRKLGTAYLPELHETCGLGVDEMYSMLRQLEAAGFIRVEGKYPFEDVVVCDEPQLHWPILRDLARFCSGGEVSLNDLVVDLRFDLLA
jgi:hypothetical protein